MQHLSFVSQKHKIPQLSAIFDFISFISSVTYIYKLTTQNTRKKLAEEEKRRVDNCHPNSQANSSNHSCNVIVLLFMSIILADPKDVKTMYISTFSNKYEEQYK